MNQPHKNIVIFFVLCVSLRIPSPSYGRTIIKRSPQLSLTVIDDGEPDSTPRGHPPSIEDLEARRQALVALIPGGGEGGGGGQLQMLTDLGLDLVGGSVRNAGELFAPLRNATRKATENFPRLGDVLNRAVDEFRVYRKQASGALRETASSKVNNGIRIFTTATARGTEVLGGVFKLLRSLFDNFTLAIQNLVQTLSRGLARFAETKTKFLSRNFQRVRNLVTNQRLFQPARDAAELGGNLVRGLAADFTNIQPLVSDGIKTKLTVGTRLIPRVRLSTILAPLGDPEHKPCAEDGTVVDIMSEGESDGGYSKKRDETSSSDEVPKDILDLLGSSKSENKVKAEGTKDDAPTSTTSSSKAEDVESNEVLTKASSSSNPTTTTTPAPSTTTDGESKSTTSKPSKEGEKAGSIEDLFGISDSKST